MGTDDLVKYSVIKVCRSPVGGMLFGVSGLILFVLPEYYYKVGTSAVLGGGPVHILAA